MYTRDLAGTRYSPLKQIKPRTYRSSTRRGLTSWVAQRPSPPGPGKRRRGRRLPLRRPPGRGGGRGRGGGGESRSHADRRQRIDVSARGPARYRARSGNRKGSLDARRCRSTARTRGVAFWPGDADNPPRIILTAGLHLIASEREHGQGRSWLRQRGHRGYRGAVERRAGDLQERGDAGRDGGRGSDRAARRFARVRCPHRRTTLGFPYHPAAWRDRIRQLGEGQLEGFLRRQRLGLVSDGR